jgi:hypothetical protein
LPTECDNILRAPNLIPSVQECEMKSGILHITALYYVYKRQYTTELASSAALQFFLFTKKKKAGR